MSNKRFRFEDCLEACGNCIWMKVMTDPHPLVPTTFECMNPERRKQKNRGDFFGEMPNEKIESDSHEDDEVVGCPFKDENQENFPSSHELEWDEIGDR